MLTGPSVPRTILVVMPGIGYKLPRGSLEETIQALKYFCFPHLENKYTLLIANQKKRDYRKCDYMLIYGTSKDNVPGRDREYFWNAHKNKNTIINVGAGFVDAFPAEEYKARLAGFEVSGASRGTAIGYSEWGGKGNYNNKNSKSDRWNSWGIELKRYNWRSRDPILIIGQQPRDAVFYKKKPFVEWVNEVCAEINKYTDRPIHYRPAPSTHYNANQQRILVFGNLPENVIIRDSNRSLMDIIQDYYATITYSSVSGCEAVISGCPVYAYSEGSMVYDLSFRDLSQIENLNDYDKQERLRWAYDIAYSQWSWDEIKQGIPQKHLGLI